MKPTLALLLKLVDWEDKAIATEKETASIAVLSTKVESLSDGMKALSTRFYVFQTNFIRNDVYALKHQELETRIARLESDLRNLKNFRYFLIVVRSEEHTSELQSPLNLVC